MVSHPHIKMFNPLSQDWMCLILSQLNRTILCNNPVKPYRASQKILGSFLSSEVMGQHICCRSGNMPSQSI